MTNTPEKSEFLKVFKAIDYGQSRYTVFADFVQLSAVSLHNVLLPSPALEEDYLAIAGRYGQGDLDRFCQLLAITVRALEVRHDFLGEVFMSVELGNAAAGQFFTPWHVSLMMAQMVMGNAASLPECGFLTLQEPACGAGSMVIAAAESLALQGLNPQACLWVRAIDIDRTVAMACYVQLSLLHIPGEVVIGDAIFGEVFAVMRTPAHVMGGWGKRLAEQACQQQRQQERGAILSEVARLDPGGAEEDEPSLPLTGSDQRLALF